MTGALLDLGRVREALAADRVTWSRHGVVRMQERGITRADVLEGLRGGQVIENYLDDTPYPSALVLGFARDRPVHVVVALDPSAPEAHILTVYEPSPDEFEPGLAYEESTMTRSYPSGLCALCGGKRRAGRVSHSVDLGDTVVVVRNVEAKVCDQCGEPWFEDATVEHLERIVHEARARGVQVEVVSLP